MSEFQEWLVQRDPLVILEQIKTSIQETEKQILQRLDEARRVGGPLDGPSRSRRIMSQGGRFDPKQSIDQEDLVKQTIEAGDIVQLPGDESGGQATSEFGIVTDTDKRAVNYKSLTTGQRGSVPARSLIEWPKSWMKPEEIKQLRMFGAKKWFRHESEVDPEMIAFLRAAAQGKAEDPDAGGKQLKGGLGDDPKQDWLANLLRGK